MPGPENFQEALAITGHEKQGMSVEGLTPREQSWVPGGLGLSPARGVGLCRDRRRRPHSALSRRMSANVQIYYHLYVPREPAF